MAFENILVVCVGNICRSPMAEALLKQRFPEKNIDSAGVGALVGHSADPAAIEIMQAQNIDISTHVAKQIDEKLAQKADLIFTMSEGQNKWIEDRASMYLAKSVLGYESRTSSLIGECVVTN